MPRGTFTPMRPLYRVYSHQNCFINRVLFHTMPHGETACSQSPLCVEETAKSLAVSWLSMDACAQPGFWRAGVQFWITAPKVSSGVLPPEIFLKAYMLFDALKCICCIHFFIFRVFFLLSVFFFSLFFCLFSDGGSPLAAPLNGCQKGGNCKRIATRRTIQSRLRPGDLLGSRLFHNIAAWQPNP